MVADRVVGARPMNAVATKVARPRARKTYQARRRLDKGHLERLGEANHGGEAEPHDVAVAAMDLADEGGAHVLDGVPTGLVETFSACNPGFDLRVAKIAEVDGGGHGFGGEVAVVLHGVGGDDGVGPACEAAKKRSVLLGVTRLSEGGSVDGDDRVGCEDGARGVHLGNGVHLRAREAFGGLDGGFPGLGCLVDVGRVHVEGHAKRAE